LPAEPPVEYCDTLTNLLPFDSLMVLPVTGGVLPGNNGLGILEYADLFPNSTYDRLKGFVVPVALAQSNFADAKIRFKVWDGGSTPGSVLGYKDVKISLLSPNFYYLFSFDSPISLNGDFYCGYQLSSNAGDKFAVSMAKDRGVGAPSTLFLNIGNVWKNVQEVSALDGLTSSLGILPVVCNTTGWKEPSLESQQLLAYPNPNNGLFQVFVGGADVFKIRVANMLGTIVYEGWSEMGGLKQLDLQGFPSGLYLIQVMTKERGFSGKVLLIND
jgi:hypothetical protein